MDDGRPIFVQIAEMIENSIIDGTYAEETQVPSTNELAAFLHRHRPGFSAMRSRKDDTRGVQSSTLREK